MRQIENIVFSPQIKATHNQLFPSTANEKNHTSTQVKNSHSQNGQKQRPEVF